MPEEENNIDVIDVENYSSGGNQNRSFSHSEIVMRSVGKCIEAGSKEMREGYYNTKRDRLGNSINIYNMDTRLEFIESIETLKMVLARDYDEDMEKQLKVLDEGLNKCFNDLCNKEKADWNTLNYIEKEKLKKDGYRFIEGIIQDKSFYYNYYLEKKVEVYRKIFSELSKLIKRLDDYQEELYEA